MLLLSLPLLAVGIALLMLTGGLFVLHVWLKAILHHAANLEQGAISVQACMRRSPPVQGGREADWSWSTSQK